MPPQMQKDENGVTLQAMPLIQGLTNLEPADGPKDDIGLVECVTDGEITITFGDNSIEDVAFIEGKTRTVIGAKTVAVKSGKFHFA